MPSLNDPVSVQTVSDSTGDVLTEATVIDELSVSTPVGSEPALPPTAPPEPK